MFDLVIRFGFHYWGNDVLIIGYPLSKKNIIIQLYFNFSEIIGKRQTWKNGRLY